MSDDLLRAMRQIEEDTANGSPEFIDVTFIWPRKVTGQLVRPGEQTDLPYIPDIPEMWELYREYAEDN